MAERLPSVLPRIAALVLVALAATAGMTYAAGSQLGSAPAVPTSAAPTPPLVVPDVRNQAFVFAKGTLEDAGFAWRVAGSVHGYAPNVVVSQSPEAGTRVVDSGAPLITLTLRRNSSYPQAGEATDTSPYQATAPEPADLAGRAIGPAAPAPATAVPAVAKPLTAAKPTTAAPKPATKPAAAKSPAAVTAAKWPQSRPVAFVMPGARKEPLDEMPLPDRAKALATWLDAHPTRTPAAATYWLYQNAWIVTGAKFGWWRGADALKTLVAVDQRAQSLWGIGAKSAAIAAQALSDVQARAK
jgi:hypothetical protein